MAHANPLKTKPARKNLSGSYFKLLTPGNPKVMKGMKRGYMTFILHFAPHDLSGYNVCPSADDCIDPCLNTSGHGGIAEGGNLTRDAIKAGRINPIQACRIRRTKLYFEDRPTFMAQLIADIRKAIAYCAKWDLIPVFRLNGTSDIRWELAHDFSGNKLIADLFPEIQFYDYTKIPNRRNLPSNYHLTFSLTKTNEPIARAMLAKGMNVAAVFRDKATVARYEASGFFNTAVHNGDESDLRFLDESGVIALYAKGNARRDTSGFVRD